MTQRSILGRLGKFDYTYIINSRDSLYLQFNKESFGLMAELLETASTNEGLSAALWRYSYGNSQNPREIIELHEPYEKAKLYHIRNCTVQLHSFGGPKDEQTGIFIFNFDKTEREKALEKLEEIFA